MSGRGILCLVVSFVVWTHDSVPPVTGWTISVEGVLMTVGVGSCSVSRSGRLSACWLLRRGLSSHEDGRECVEFVVWVGSDDGLGVHNWVSAAAQFRPQCCNSAITAFKNIWRAQCLPPRQIQRVSSRRMQLRRNRGSERRCVGTKPSTTYANELMSSGYVCIYVCMYVCIRVCTYVYAVSHPDSPHTLTRTIKSARIRRSKPRWNLFESLWTVSVISKENLRITNSNQSLIAPRTFTSFTLNGKFVTDALPPEFESSHSEPALVPVLELRNLALN